MWSELLKYGQSQYITNFSSNFTPIPPHSQSPPHETPYLLHETAQKVLKASLVHAIFKK
jgi:hypothetical protein